MADNDEMLRRSEVERMTGLSCSSIYRMMRAKKFPKPLKLSPGPRGGVRWRKSEIVAYLEDLPRAAGEAA